MRPLSWLFVFLVALPSLALAQPSEADHSIAREWNEVLLQAIRNDFARPTVHARNLFHISAAMYDAWAVYDEVATPYFLGQTHRGFHIPFEGVPAPLDVEEARRIAISHAAYRLIIRRFKDSPGFEGTKIAADNLLSKYYPYQFYNVFDFPFGSDFSSTDYEGGNPAYLGNYIAAKIYEFGLTDGSNEADGYANRFYQPKNQPFLSYEPGTNGEIDPHHWQPIRFGSEPFIDQSGQVFGGYTTPPFLSPEWGAVVPFSLTESDLTIYQKEGHEYWVYHDPGPPVYLSETDQHYQWNFSLVAAWSGHHDPTDGVIWDISPASIGNIPFESLPKTHDELADFYDFENGGDHSPGYALNPKTNLPYEPQLVPRGDYSRVLAEFWADGPKSETPPGHWFTILNYVSDHPELVKKYQGNGELLYDLEWDVKAYFALGGAMHDVAITAWGIKGYYDYIRPISAIRFLAENGQCSDPVQPNYAQDGVLLLENSIRVNNGIEIRGWNNQAFPEVNWIAGNRWVPYQRPTFVTPPFAGYISGHSTYSRAAAEVLTLFTGDEYFPGGMAEFEAKKDQFLVFETGPSQDVTLQWAKYADASDQCSLSRIWGGIHPPVDDIPGRRIGHDIGIEAFAFANRYFTGAVSPQPEPENQHRFVVAPNPVKQGEYIQLITQKFDEFTKHVSVYDANGHLVQRHLLDYTRGLGIPSQNLEPGIYSVVIQTHAYREVHRVMVN